MAKKWVMGLAAVGLAAALAWPAAAQDRTLKLSSGFPPNGIGHQAHMAVADFIMANSDLKVEVFALALLNLVETSPGVRDGIADIGYVATPYHPAEYANSNLAADLGMLSTTGARPAAPGLVMSAAFAEYVLLNCPECLTEFKAQNQVYVGAGSSVDYVLLCTKPIRTLDDLKGKKIRSGAANFGRWVENFGAVKISVPGNETYEALSQGVVDCTISSTADLISFQLFDVIKHVVTGVPGGVFAGIGSTNTNLDTWKSLTDNQREALLRAGALMTAEVGVRYVKFAMDAEAQAAGKGIEIAPASPEMVSATAAFVEKDMTTISRQFADLYGVKDVDAKAKVIAGLIEKWKGKLEGLDPTDGESYREMLWNEVYAKLDPAVYGMD